MPKAYSYIRFSTPEQLKGDSLRRQKEASEKYAYEHGLELDTHLNMRDLGISAYDKSNVTKGALGEFLRLVRDNKIDRGSYLLVENLDRLSRANALDALPVFTEIINAGITIVTLSDTTVYSREVIEKDPWKLMLTLLIMSRANEESAVKAQRLRAAWQQKHRNIKSKRLTKRCPYWMRPTSDENGFEFIPEKLEVVRKIIAMAKDGMGNTTIVQRLNQSKVPPFSTRSDGWMPSYVQKILKSPALYGEFNASGKLSEPISDYFPAVMSKEEWLLLDSIRKTRHTKGGVSKGPQLSNLFSGLLVCGHCGGPMNMGGYATTKPYPKHRKYVACSRARRGKGCKFITWTYPHLEDEIIRFCKSVDFGSVLGRTSSLSERAAEATKASLLLKDKIKAHQEKLKKLITLAETSDKPPKSIIESMNEHEAQIADLQLQDETMMENAQIWGSEAVQQSHQQEAIIEILDKLQALQGTELHDLRIALSSKIKRVIDKIELYPAGRWLDDQKLAELRNEMYEFGIDEKAIKKDLQFYSAVKKDERFLKIRFKNGWWLRLSKDHATPYKGEESEGAELMPEPFPLAREDYLSGHARSRMH